VAALAADLAFDYLDGPITRLCGPDVPTMPFAQTLEDAYMPSTEKIASALRKLAAY
jgi:2-oxoisovalerate dehydrogenase E1 component beta subunit